MKRSHRRHRSHRLSSSLARLLAAGLLVIAAWPSTAAGSESPAADGDRWPQFRGPGGLGVATGTGIPVDWDLERNLLWQTEIEGRGHSSPVIWGNLVFLTTAIEGDVIPGATAPVHMNEGEPFKHPDSVGSDHSHKFEVMAVDAGTGDIVWAKVSYEGRVYDDRHKRGSYASPTPVTDGERLYAYFGSEGLYAYDFDGALVWKTDIGDIKTMGMGVGTSPVLYENLILIQADEDEGKSSALVAVDKTTGKEAWRVARPVQVSWSTPLLAVDHRGRSQLVTSGYEYLIAYDPADGKEIWRVKGLESNAIHSPLAAGDGLVVLTAGFPRKITAAVKLDVTGDHSQEEGWAWSYSKGTGYVISNLILDGRVYLVSDGGVVTCLDATSGDVVYEGGRLPERGTFMASPIAVDGNILLISTDGYAALVKGGPEFEVLSARSLGEKVIASPAVAGGRLFIRGERHLIAVGKKDS